MENAPVAAQVILAIVPIVGIVIGGTLVYMLCVQLIFI